MKQYIITLLLLGISMGAWAEGSVTITFSEGSTPKSQRGVTTNVLFDDVTTTVDLTVSGCVIVPGERTYNGTRLVDFYGAVGDHIFDNMKDVNQLDCETFYFKSDYTTADEVTSALSNGLWAYTFTGWHIKNTKSSSAKSTYIQNGYYAPAQTVFQPGDVITPAVLKDFGLENGGTLQLEAVWGKCYFVKDNGTGSASNNVYKPKTFDNTYSSSVTGSSPEYAYGVVFMLTGETHFKGFSASNYFTVKSLQAEIDGSGNIVRKDGLKYDFVNSEKANPKLGYKFRIDNVKSSRKSGVGTSYYWFTGGMPSYVEFTARLENFFCTLASTTQTLFVLNGGNCKSSEWLGWATSPSYPLDIFVGRNCIFDNDLTPGLSNTSDLEYKGLTTVTITGGTFKGVVSLEKNVGIYKNDLTLYVYGDKSGKAEYDPVIPEINASPLKPIQANVYMTINGCTNLTNVYGGGSPYTATTNGNTYLNIYNSIISGSINVGGKDGSVEGTANLTMKNSTVKGNVYGSGNGASSISTTTEQFSSNIDANTVKGLNWISSAPKDFPKYEDNGTYLIYKRTYVSWWSYEASGTYNASLIQYHAQLSSAHAGNTNLNMEDCIIGEEGTTKGNVYGGGADATVTGNTTLNLKNCTVYGSVYGGGDGVTQPAPVKLCKPLPTQGFTYTAPKASDFVTAYNADHSVLAWPQRPDPNDAGYDWVDGKPTIVADNYGEYYSWTNDATLSTKGIDETNHLLYSANMVGWGDVYGSTEVTLTGGTVYGNVFGGGNAGKVGYNSVSGENKGGGTTLLIDGTDVRGSVFGGGNAALIGGNTSVKIIGPAKVAGNVYGGGNAADVAGKTNVQIGEPKK